MFEEGVGDGPAPRMQQHVPFAESFALLMALRRCQGLPFFFGTEFKFVIDALAKGPEHGRSGWFIYAGVWARIWSLIEDIGGAQEVTLRKIKAHTSRSAVLREESAETDPFGQRGSRRPS